MNHYFFNCIPFLKPLLGKCHILQKTTSQSALTFQFTINQLQVDFITTEDKCYYKVRQIRLFQSRAKVFTNWGRFFVLQSGASGVTKECKYYKVGQFFYNMGGGITKQENFYYKVGQLLQTSAQKANERNRKKQYNLATYSLVQS